MFDISKGDDAKRLRKDLDSLSTRMAHALAITDALFACDAETWPWRVTDMMELVQPWVKVKAARTAAGSCIVSQLMFPRKQKDMTDAESLKLWGQTEAYMERFELKIHSKLHVLFGNAFTQLKQKAKATPAQ